MRSDKLLEYTLSSNMKYTISEARKLLYFMINPEEIDHESHYHKFLFFEMYPLLYLGEYLPNVKWIRFSGSLQKYDGEIKFRKNSINQKIEFVRAVNSENEALLSQIRKVQETFPNLNFEKDSEVKPLNDKELFRKLKEMKWLWRKAIKLKATKNLKTKQYSGVWLGIVFDDSNFPKKSYSKLRTRIQRICHKNSKLINRSFKRIFFIGLSGNFIFDSDKA